MTRSALRMAIQQAGSRACAASSMNKVLNLRPVNILLAELTSVQAITRASPNNASLMRISSSVARMGHRTKRFFQWSGKMGERF